MKNGSLPLSILVSLVAGAVEFEAPAGLKVGGQAIMVEAPGYPSPDSGGLQLRQSCEKILKEE